MAKPNFDDLKNQLESATTVVVLLPQNPKIDAVAAALSLKLSLEQIHKTVQVSCPDPMTVEFHRLVGVDTISTNIGSRNLIITFPGQTEAVDKVSYNIENGVLQLVITPKSGTAGLDHRKLQFVSGSPQTDLVILVNGAQIPEVFAQTKQFSLAGSEEVTHLLETLKIPFSADPASNLLLGLEKSTANFTVNVTADTFEAATVLMRHGAKRADVAAPSSFPAGSIPVTQTPPDDQVIPTPTDDWYEPKIYRGTTQA